MCYHSVSLSEANKKKQKRQEKSTGIEFPMWTNINYLQCACKNKNFVIKLVFGYSNQIESNRMMKKRKSNIERGVKSIEHERHIDNNKKKNEWKKKRKWRNITIGFPGWVNLK